MWVEIWKNGIKVAVKSDVNNFIIHKLVQKKLSMKKQQIRSKKS